MPRTGRPPIPLEVKRRRGTLRPDRVPNRGAGMVELDPIDRELLADATLADAAAAAVTAAPWCDDSTLPTVAALAEAVELYAELRADPKSNPRDVLAALRAVSEMIQTLGLSPVSRARLGLGEMRR